MDRYVVEIRSRPHDEEEAARTLAAAFKVDTGKVRKLLKRLPDVVTKAVSQSEAEAVARRFREAGLEAVVRPADAPAPPTPTPPPDAVEMSAAELKRELAARQRAHAPAPIPSATVAAEVTPSVERHETVAEPRRRRGSLRRKLLAVAIIPTLLTVAGALLVTWLTARPALYDQLLATARNPAIATAASLSSALEGGIEAGTIDYLQLQETIQLTRQAFQRQNISFIVATDTAGNPLSGWFVGAESLTADVVALQNAIRDQAVSAVALGTTAQTGQSSVPTAQLVGAGGTRIEIVAQPLLSRGQPFGAVIVGVTDQEVARQVEQILINILLFSSIPVALAILIAAWRARGLSRNVLYLTEKADQISRGDLDARIELKSNDELDDLSEALERMRISMKEALERLRRRRI
jgi:HAMP domain-containing protein